MFKDHLILFINRFVPIVFFMALSIKGMVSIDGYDDSDIIKGFTTVVFIFYCLILQLFYMAPLKAVFKKHSKKKQA